ncbi:MAG: hypothetical protein KatS3mg087_1834 [Patescibacteria group bacterium]|nr:MAG: hypothetical protein KatS3mg087_1834 [Patescibacteria group bacterium]
MTGPQSRTAQKRILEEAKKRGETGDLFWYIVVRRKGGKYVPGCFPPFRVPVVPVGDDPEESRHYAHLMLEIAKAGTPGLILNIELTSRDLLNENIPGRWYEWGDTPPHVEYDFVCKFCGSVSKGPYCDLCRGT